MFATYCTPGGTATAEIPTVGMNGQNRFAEMTGLHPAAYGLQTPFGTVPTNMAYGSLVGTPVVNTPFGWNTPIVPSATPGTIGFNPTTFSGVTPSFVGGVTPWTTPFPTLPVHPAMGLNPIASALSMGIPTTTFGVPCTTPWGGLLNPFNPAVPINPFAAIYNPFTTLPTMYAPTPIHPMGVHPINAVPIRVNIPTPAGVVPAIGSVTTTINPVTGTPVTAVTNVVPSFPFQHGALGIGSINPFCGSAWTNPCLGTTPNPCFAPQNIAPVNPYLTTTPCGTMQTFVNTGIGCNPLTLGGVTPWTLTNPLSAIYAGVCSPGQATFCGVNPLDGVSTLGNVANPWLRSALCGTIPQTGLFGTTPFCTSPIGASIWNPTTSNYFCGPTPVGHYVNPLYGGGCGISPQSIGGYGIPSVCGPVCAI